MLGTQPLAGIGPAGISVGDGLCCSGDANSHDDSSTINTAISDGGAGLDG